MKLNFKGTLNDKLRGFYRSSFKDASGKMRTIATTQMEPADARRMFPCFDEPAYKATFQITVVIPSDLTAISNGPIVSTTLDEKSQKLVVTFAETPKMSSYLVALVVGPFDSTQPVTSEGVQVRVWYLAGKPNLGNYARDIAANLLPFYHQYFGVHYPEKKLDLVAIPDFEAGAMENLGCITFRESRLLVDTPTASIHQKMDVTSVIAHEIAHMWFGDLVTMKWWDDLWLNEAFATWMSHKAVNHLHPEWHVWEEFNNSREGAMNTDSLASSRPIHFAVANPLQANEMFDEITYSKGASILRMLETYVGEDVFQNGVQEYIKAHKFGNAATSDLWAGISSASKKNINELMKEWVSKAGYPLVTVERPGEGKVVLKQSRFFLVGKDDKEQHAESLWQVPIIAHNAGGDNTEDSYLLTGEEATWDTGKLSVPFVINKDGNGYFRTHYPQALLKELAQHKDKLSVGERFGLLCDQWALAYSGKEPIGEYLDWTASLKDETDANVIKHMVWSFYKLYDLVDDKHLPAVSALVRDRLAPIQKKLGWQGTELDPVNTVLLREQVIVAMGTIGEDKETIEKARKVFAEYQNDRTSV
ncbi:MAG TPA: M1 family metallopeptidase, partial [Chroococcales cyanobacterium]